MVAISDFSTFSQMTCNLVRQQEVRRRKGEATYGDAVGILLTNAFGFCLALLKRVLVLELGTHIDGVDSIRSTGVEGRCVGVARGVFASYGG